MGWIAQTVIWMQVLKPGKQLFWSSCQLSKIASPIWYRRKISPKGSTTVFSEALMVTRWSLTVKRWKQWQHTSSGWVRWSLNQAPKGVGLKKLAVMTRVAHPGQRSWVIYKQMSKLSWGWWSRCPNQKTPLLIYPPLWCYYSYNEAADCI